MIQHSDSVPIVRGCGRRDPGGTYLMSKLVDVGMPWWYWLCDPPVPIPPPTYAKLRLNDRGSQLIRRPDADVFDVWDIVGQGRAPDPVKGKGYWNVLDYAIEVGYAGASRKAAPSLPLHKLSRESRLVLLHRRACILNWRDYLRAVCNIVDDGAWMHPSWTCVKRLAQHMTPAQPPEEQCASLWFHDVEGGDVVSVANDDKSEVWAGVTTRASQSSFLTPVVRRMPAFAYRAWARPPAIKPAYELGIFMLLPINGIDVINDADRGQHVAALEAAQRSPFEVTLCEA